VTQVIVYKNLTRGCWSIATPKGARGRGPLQGHTDAVSLVNVTFVVSAASQRAVANGGHRSVHAWAVGEIAPAAAPQGERVTYRPHTAPDFVLMDGTPVSKAARVDFAADGLAYATNPN
jgi:hypothetical protein